MWQSGESRDFYTGDTEMTPTAVTADQTNETTNLFCDLPLVHSETEAHIDQLF